MRAKSYDITTAADGSHSGTVGMPTCRLYGIRLDNEDTAAGTCQVANMGRNLMTGVATNADSYRQMREQAKDAADVAIAGQYEVPLIHGDLTVTIAGAGNAKKMKLIFFYE